MKSSTLAALVIALGLSSFGAAHAAVNPNLPSTPATVTAVPEPATWALMLVGAAAIGYSLRTRRSVRKA